jgi:hypothetical protein
MTRTYKFRLIFVNSSGNASSGEEMSDDSNPGRCLPVFPSVHRLK